MENPKYIGDIIIILVYLLVLVLKVSMHALQLFVMSLRQLSSQTEFAQLYVAMTKETLLIRLLRHL